MVFLRCLAVLVYLFLSLKTTGHIKLFRGVSVDRWDLSTTGFTLGVFTHFIEEAPIIVPLDFSLWDWWDSPKKNFSGSHLERLISLAPRAFRRVRDGSISSFTSSHTQPLLWSLARDVRFRCFSPSFSRKKWKGWAWAVASFCEVKGRSEDLLSFSSGMRGPHPEVQGGNPGVPIKSVSSLQPSLSFFQGFSIDSPLFSVPSSPWFLSGLRCHQSPN